MNNRILTHLGVKFLNTWLRLWLRPGKLGKDSFILPPYRIINSKRLFIGENTRIGKYAFIICVTGYNEKKYNPIIEIGSNVSIGHDCVISSTTNITIEDNVLISQRVLITDTLHGYEDVNISIIDQDLTKCKPVIIERDSFVGVNGVILPGVRIGKHAVIGAGSVVTRDVAPYTVVAGNPARPIKRYSEEKNSWIRV